MRAGEKSGILPRGRERCEAITISMYVAGSVWRRLRHQTRYWQRCAASSAAPDEDLHSTSGQFTGEPK
jgi:hypothetical protein